MTWPMSGDYREAVQNPSANFGDAALRQGRPSTHAAGTTDGLVGSFADVYKLECPGRKTWAVKCFTREVPGLQQRYHSISEHLEQIPHPVHRRIPHICPKASASADDGIRC